MPAASDPALEADLACLMRLLGDGDVSAAREFARVLKERWPDSERVQHYAHVLGPATTRVRPDLPPRNRDQEWAWLQKHAQQYPGHWLAVLGDDLIAADPDVRTVLRKVRTNPAHAMAILWFEQDT